MKNAFKDRYGKNIVLKEIGLAGQKQLSNSKAVIIGIGALGSMVANNLARAGVGRLTLVDRDFVELSNLQRQILFNERDIGRPKAIAAAEKLKNINSSIEYNPILKDVNFSDIEVIIKGSDIVIDGTDNMETRYLMNDACMKADIPWIYGGVIGTYGMTMNIIPRKTPCLRCIFPTIPGPGVLPTCDNMGVLGAIAATIGSIESVEAIKIILRKKEVCKLLLTYDVWEHSFRPIKVAKRSDCPCCDKNEFVFLNQRKKLHITKLCGAYTVQITPIQAVNIDLSNLANQLEHSGPVKLNDYALIFKAHTYEITIFRDGRALIKGTDNENLARSLYARYCLDHRIIIHNKKDGPAGDQLKI